MAVPPVTDSAARFEVDGPGFEEAIFTTLLSFEQKASVSFSAHSRKLPTRDEADDTRDLVLKECG